MGRSTRRRRRGEPPPVTDPATGLIGEPEGVLRHVLGAFPDLRTPYERDRALDVIARVSLLMLGRIAELDEEVAKLRQRVKKPARSTPAPDEKPPLLQLPTSPPPKPRARLRKKKAPRKTGPNQGSLAWHVLELLREDGGWWTAREIQDHLQREHPEPPWQITDSSIGCTLNRLRMTHQVKRRYRDGPTPLRYEHHIEEWDA